MLTKPFTELDVLGCFVQPIVPMNVIKRKSLTIASNGRVANNQLFKLFIGGQFAIQSDLAVMPKVVADEHEEELALESDRPGFPPLVLKLNPENPAESDTREPNNWLSEFFQHPCQLRPITDTRIPQLVIASYGSFIALNNALTNPLPIESLAANLVIDAEPWAEMNWGTEVSINQVQFVVGEPMTHPQLDVVKLNWKEEGELTSAQKLFRPYVVGNDRRLRFGRMAQPVTGGKITRFMFAA